MQVLLKRAFVSFLGIPASTSELKTATGGSKCSLPSLRTGRRAASTDEAARAAEMLLHACSGRLACCKNGDGNMRDIAAAGGESKW